MSFGRKDSQMKNLWEVHVVNRQNENPVGGDPLWIIAATAASASKKAESFGKRELHQTARVTKVIGHGTIDA